MVVVVLAAAYTIARSVTRELKTARLQSDFVSAVSHEFRTPLASLRQLSELLAEGRVSSDERRQAYYEALRRESERLHRLVENILDFGRMEAKARGVKFGRNRTIDRNKILALQAKGIGATNIAKQMGIGRSTVYKLLNETGESRQKAY